MRPTHPARWLAVLSLLAVLTVFLVDTGRTLPTPISTVHAEIAQLDGSAACIRCHGESKVELGAACLECHEFIAQDIESGRGMHGAVVEQVQARCGECHQEHAGRDFSLVSAQSFAFAGYVRREEFDHPWDSYALRGAHDSLACEECHAAADRRLLAEGEQRYRGLSQDCSTCHEDGDHNGQMERACDRCHGQSLPFEDLGAFVHDERFPLEGLHADRECIECHERGGTHSIERSASAEQEPAVRGCAACHEAPHTASFLDQMASQYGQLTAEACPRCHTSGAEPWTSASLQFDAVWHAASGFELLAPHQGLECIECHGLPGTWQERFPGRVPEACEACHEDPHAGQFNTDVEDRSCRQCHALERFVPGSFDALEHAATKFPLEESHRAVACYACHETQAGSAADRHWADVETTCSSCHEDGHASFFEEFATASGQDAPQDCSVCHGENAFATADTDREFEHLRWTGYALEGTHESTACTSCHATGEPDAGGRRFGRIADRYGALPSDEAPCLPCHANPHDVNFDGPGRPTRVQGRAGCARCHVCTTFAAVEPGFDHDQWTDRRLEGAHLALECEQCHPRTPVADEKGRRFGRPRKVFGDNLEACDTCHADPHGGLFDQTPAGIDVAGRGDCARCHGEQNFRSNFTLEFDHDAWTGTDLRGAHGDPGCETCHPALGFFDAGARSTRPALGRTCVACHRDPHAGQFSAPGAANCEDCHADQRSWQELIFDHGRDSSYVLDTTHAALACEQCHPSTRMPNGELITRYKPLGSACADCHSVGGEDPR